MTLSARFLFSVSSAVLFTILVLLSFLGYWKADPTVQIIFFFVMVSAIFNAGIETRKSLRYND